MKYANEVWSAFAAQYPEYATEDGRDVLQAAKDAITGVLRDWGLNVEDANSFELLAAAKQGNVIPLVLEKANTAPPSREQLIELIVGLLQKFGTGQTDHALSTARTTLGFKTYDELVARLNELVRKQSTKHW